MNVNDKHFDRHSELYAGEIGEQINVPGRQFATVEVDGLVYLTQNMKKRSSWRDLCRDNGWKITWIKRSGRYVARIVEHDDVVALVKLNPDTVVEERKIKVVSDNKEDDRMSPVFTITCSAASPAPGCKGKRSFSPMPVDQRLRIMTSFIESGGLCSVCRDAGGMRKSAVQGDAREITFVCSNRRCINKITCKRSEVAENRYCPEHRQEA